MIKNKLTNWNLQTLCLMMLLWGNSCSRQTDERSSSNAEAEDSQLQESVSRYTGSVTGVAAALNGKALYANNCEGCHGPLAQSTKRGRSAAKIKAQISNNPVINTFMRGISLSDAEIAAIARALLPVTAHYQKAEYRVRLLDRVQLQTRLARIFSSAASPSEKTVLLALINQEVGKHPETFAGSCSRSDGTCGAHPGDRYLYAEAIPFVSIARAGRLQRVCLRLASRSAGVGSFAALVSGTSPVAPTEAQVRALPASLGLDYAPGSNVKTKLVDLWQASQSYSAPTQWRLLAVTLCSSLVMEEL